ncbi:DNA transposase THAP9, partial [Araneus ventricosus]
MFDGPALEMLLRASGLKKGKYAPELRSFALTLHFYSKKAYVYVRKVFKTCLPHTSTVKKWYQVVDGSPGFTKEALEVLKCKAVEASQRNRQLVCCLIIDEMSIRRQTELDNGKLCGYVDYGTDLESPELPIANSALTFMVNAVNGNWKIPIAYFLIDGLNAIERTNLIKIALECLHETGIKVVALTFDGLLCNFKVGNELGARLEAVNLKSTFPHPITGEDVCIFLDPCHCLKLVRNTLGSKGSMFDANNQIIDWSYVVKLEKFQQDEGLLAATKIRNRHIQWYNEKMKVKLAAQTLSESVANALDWLANDLKKAEFKGCDATVRFIRLFDKLFDSLNSRNLLSKGFKSPIKMDNAKTFFDFYNECDLYLRNLTISKDGINVVSSKWRTGFLGFLICIESVKGLYKSLIEPDESALSFLMTYKFSQDHLETFFSMIRSHGGYNNNPSAKQFKAAYKQLLVRHEIASSENANCISLSKINILSVGSQGKSKNNFVQNINHDNDRRLSDDLQIIDNSEAATSDHAYSKIPSSKILSEYVEDVVAYISGFVQRKLISAIKCEECSDALIYDENSAENSYRLINRKNKGGLIKPSKDVYQLCKIGEKSFRIIQAAGKITSKNVLELLIADSMRKIN